MEQAGKEEGVSEEGWRRGGGEEGIRIMLTITKVCPTMVLPLHYITGPEESLSSSPSDTSSPQIPIVGRLSYAIIGDSFDKTINPRFMTSNLQRKSLHFFHSYALLDWVNCSHLDWDKPIGDVGQLPLTAFIPSAEDSALLRSNYAILVARVMMEKMEFFKKHFKNVVPSHIPHQYSELMKMRSSVVSACMYVLFFVTP